MEEEKISLLELEVRAKNVEARCAFMEEDYESWDHVRTTMHRSQVTMKTATGAEFEMFGFPNNMLYFFGLSGHETESLVDDSPDPIVRIWWIAAEVAVVLDKGFIHWEDKEGTVLLYDPHEEYERMYTAEREWAKAQPYDADTGYIVSSSESSGPYSSDEEEEEEEQEEPPSKRQRHQ